MGMCIGLVTLSDANIERVLSDPPLIWRVLAPDDPEPYEQARRGQGQSLLGWLFGSKSVMGEQQDLDVVDGEQETTDLDKAWNGIHYLFTGTASEGSPPLNFLILGGREVGTLEVGYGPARVLTSTQTKEIHDALSQLTDQELRRRFDPKDMSKKDVYPNIWMRDPKEDDTLGYLMEYVSILREFLAKAEKGHFGLVIEMS